MDVLDGPDRETSGDLDLLTRMRTPGAIELLAAYELMAPEARTSLVGLSIAIMCGSTCEGGTDLASDFVARIAP